MTPSASLIPSCSLPHKSNLRARSSSLGFHLGFQFCYFAIKQTGSTEVAREDPPHLPWHGSFQPCSPTSLSHPEAAHFQLPWEFTLSAAACRLPGGANACSETSAGLVDTTLEAEQNPRREWEEGKTLKP